MPVESMEIEVFRRGHRRLSSRLSLVRPWLLHFPLPDVRPFDMRSLGPGALTRALLTLPRDSFDKLIVLEEQADYLKYLKVTGPFGSAYTLNLPLHNI